MKTAEDYQPTDLIMRLVYELAKVAETPNDDLVRISIDLIQLDMTNQSVIANRGRIAQWMRTNINRVKYEHNLTEL